MTERKKQILSLALSATLLLSLTGCKKDSIKREFNEETKQFEYTGIIDSEAFKKLYIVEYITSDNWKNVTLVREEQKSIVGLEYRDFDGYVIENDSVRHILDVKSLSSYIEGDLKEYYTGEEIFEIYEEIRNEYHEKKLELKNNE